MEMEIETEKVPSSDPGAAAGAFRRRNIPSTRTRTRIETMNIASSGEQVKEVECRGGRQEQEQEQGEQEQEQCALLVPPSRCGQPEPEPEPEEGNIPIFKRICCCIVPSQSLTFEFSWLKPVQNWTLLFLFVWAMLLLFSSTALVGIVVIQLMASIMVWICFIHIVVRIINAFRQCMGMTLPLPLPLLPSPNKAYVWWYPFLVSIVLLWKPGWYVTTFFWCNTSPTMEHILYELQYEPTTTMKDIENRPMQALFLGNDYARRLGEALTVHFDRYQRNETAPFGYVTSLNLIGNLFDDDGVEAIVDALDHPFSYTDTLLLGRNEHIGDRTAARLANLITSTTTNSTSTTHSNAKNSSSNPNENIVPVHDVAGKELIWLEFGGTSVTKIGLSELYHSMGTRPFSYLGLEYTRRGNSLIFFPFVTLFQKYVGKSTTVSQSLESLHEATQLQWLSLTGNNLNDDDISTLANEALQMTNITTLTLFNNKIGPVGVKHLIPLTTRLKELALSMNPNIGDDGAELLAEALKNPNATIETLFLTNCHIGQRGADALLSIFPTNTRLKFLMLTSGRKHNGIEEETIKALEKATAANWR